MGSEYILQNTEWLGITNDEKYQLQSEEANYSHSNAGLRLKSLCNSPVLSVYHTVARSEVCENVTLEGGGGGGSGGGGGGGRCLELRPLLLLFQVEMTALCLSLCVILSHAFPFCFLSFFLSFFCIASYVYRVFDTQEAARSRR